MAKGQISNLTLLDFKSEREMAQNWAIVGVFKSEHIGA